MSTPGLHLVAPDADQLAELAALAGASVYDPQNRYLSRAAGRRLERR